MTARDLDLQTSTPETPEPIPQGPAETEAKQKFTAEGELPAVATSTSSAATASELGFANKRDPIIDLSILSHLDHGMVHWEMYKMECEQAGKPEMWKDEYVHGHTEARGWTQPMDWRSQNEFKLKKGTSASQALKDFMAGPTITDWHAAQVALDIEDLRTELGDAKFDRLFGSAKDAEDINVPKEQRLKIWGGDVTTRYVDHMREIANAYDAREAEPVHVEDFVEPKLADKPKPEDVSEAEDLVVKHDLEVEQVDREHV